MSELNFAQRLAHMLRILKCLTKAVVVLVSVVATVVIPRSVSGDQVETQETQVRSVWTDPSNGLMWAARDNGRDVSWNKAMKFCFNLRLDGYSDWRLANMRDLQGIYDQTAEAPGLAGKHDDEPTTWHVKGNLFLTGYEWSSNYRTDERSHPVGYAYYFDFNEGKPNDTENGYSTFKRALCVRGFRPDGAQ